jgi:teichuronic acid biosynthesis glycosyltransferase TuaC
LDLIFPLQNLIAASKNDRLHMTMNYPLRILVLTKRQYTNRDILDDRFGRIRELPLQLALRGYQVSGLCLSYKKKKEGKTIDGPVLWESVNAGPLKITGLLRFILRASSLAAHADLIWACSDSFYGIIGHWLSRRFHIPLVFDLYDNYEYFLAGKTPGIRQLYRSVLRKCDGVTCVSRPLARLVMSYGRKGPLCVIENAVPKDLFRPLDKRACRADLGIPQNIRIIGSAGALYKNRGIPALMRAFALLRKRFPDLQLALAGPRDIEIPRNGGIWDLGILPYQRVPLFFNALDVGVVCNLDNDFSRYCFPQKAREIMACNIPLVAAKIGSMAELFADRPAWLFKAGDPADLSRAIKNRLSDQSTGYQDVPAWSDLADNLQAFFLDILKGRRQSFA